MSVASNTLDSSLEYSMENLVKKKKKILDGEESEFIALQPKVQCSNCEKYIEYNISGSKSLLALENTMISSLVEKLPNVTKNQLGDTVFYKVGGLPIRYVDLKCGFCGSTCLAVFGAGEYQPARYIVELVGLFAMKK